jgi:hypothetical protein
VDRGVSRGQRGGSPTVVNLSFLDRNNNNNNIIIKLKTYSLSVSDEQAVTISKFTYFTEQKALRAQVKADVLSFGENILRVPRLEKSVI